MSLTDGAASVTAGDLLNLQAGITAQQNSAEATTEAALIQAGKDTVGAYAARLEAGAMATSEVVMATVSLMQSPPGGVPTAGKLLTPTSPANEFQHLTVTYLPAQQAFAQANNLNITIYNAEAVALGIGAGGDGTQNNFLKNFGSSALSVSQFETALFNLTNVSVAAIDAQYQFFLKLYGASPAYLPGGYPNADAAARAATFGFAVGTDFANPTLNPTLIAQIENAKVLNALTINGDVSGAAGYQTNVALGLQPTAPPLQSTGEFNSLVLTPGVDNLTATTAGQIFVALPASNPPLSVTNTLNAGDNLQTKGTAVGSTTLQFTAINSLINPPLAFDVTMNGVNTAIVTNNATVTAGFSGNITGLVNVAASSLGAPILLGLATAGLNTALAQITLSSNEVFTAWMTAAALGGAADAATVNLTNVNDATAELDVTTGTNGYETLTANSIGIGPNRLELDTNATSTATLNATGNQNLILVGSALNIANLHTYDGSAATGMQNVFFNGTGNVKATGGSNNDTFTFTSLGGATFTSASSVDGGGGTNELEIQANNGALLGAGVGPNITNIQVVEHIGVQTGNLTVDMSRSGSANELDLAGEYGLFDVTVNNLTNAKTVLYEGGGALGSLTLLHTTPLGILDVINLTMARDAETPGQPANLTLISLLVGQFVGQAIAALDLNSTGTATDNVINNVNPVQANVIVTGGTHLTFGSAVGAYSFAGGTIDASTDTGGVAAWFANIGAPTTPAQTFIGGPGNDILHTLNFTADLINFSNGGSDIVDFHQAFFNGGGPLANNPGFSYNTVLGFAQANDRIDLTNSPFLGDIAFTNDGVVPAGAATGVLDFTMGAIVNASALPDNWIKIVTPTSGAGLTVAQGMAESIGLLGAIQVSAGHNYLVSYYDLTDSQAVFATIDTAAGGAPTFITAGDATSAGVHLIGLIHMSQADYAALAANNLHFV